MHQRTLKKFRDEIYRYYRTNERELPWRMTNDPYNIWVSEIMLQQTQVNRVIEKYRSFLQKFPTVHALAEASLADVLIEWQGLGYNRRGKALHQGAKKVVQDFDGVVPRSRKELESLPGIGHYTAGAIRAFAFNVPEVFIETNIRTVYLHFFFEHRDSTVHDNELLELIEETVDHDNPRDWYLALMDYGAMLKKKGIKLNDKSRHYTKQSKFEGSDRQIRGMILKLLAEYKTLTTKKILTLTRKERPRVEAQLESLKKEGMIIQQKQSWLLAT